MIGAICMLLILVAQAILNMFTALLNHLDSSEFFPFVVLAKKTSRGF